MENRKTRRTQRILWIIQGNGTACRLLFEGTKEIQFGKRRNGVAARRMLVIKLSK